MYNFKASSFEENSNFVKQYLDSLSNVYDNFLEDHILNSKIYSISLNDKHIGYFGIYNNTKLTQFYIIKEFLKHSQIIFKKILDDYNIKTAFVPTCDELFLSLSLDFHKEIDMQAYFFTDNIKEVETAKYSRDLFYMAKEEDISSITNYSEDFFDNIEKRIKKNEIFILKDKDTILGFGVMEQCNIFKDYISIGMFTVKEHRQKGVGRSIIIHLKDICYERGFKPLPGCWYHNYNSKNTLESSGFISKTRLLNIIF